LQERIGYLLKHPVGPPSLEVRRSYANFTYQAGSWTKPRRVVAKIEWHPANCTLASTSSSPTWRGRPRTSSASTTSAEPASSGYGKAKARSEGHGFRVALAFQMADVAISRNLFADILGLIAELRPLATSTA
jgi:hypothetical protein